MKKLPLKLTEEMIKIWKQCVIDYLTKLYGKPIPGLAEALMEPGVLEPMFKYKGEFLLKPGEKVMHAWYLKKGMAKLFTYDEHGEAKIFYIWNADSIIVLYKAFRERLPSQDCYIQLMEDSELVSITSMSMDDIYAEHTAAHELTTKILYMKTEQRDLLTGILKMTDKLRRYCVLKQKFSWLFVNGKCRLSNEEICSLIDISITCLKRAKKICPDKGSK